jgi:hypothetical protein
VIVATCEDQDSILQMCEQTELVINCTSQNLRNCSVVVNACIDSRTDYLDFTTDESIISVLKEKYDEKARENEVLIIPACGYHCVSANAFHHSICQSLSLSPSNHPSSYYSYIHSTLLGSCQKILGSFSPGTSSLMVSSLRFKDSWIIQLQQLPGVGMLVSTHSSMGHLW